MILYTPNIMLSKRMSDRVAIITGGSGFIGSHLIENLIESKIFNKIIILDIYQLVIVNEKLSFFSCNIMEVIKIPLEDKYDYTIFHLAALCKEPGYSWEEYFETNYFGTKNVCEFALRNKIKNIIFTSTMMVYKAGEKRNNEEDLTAPETAYGISKLLAEEVLLSWKNSNPNHRLRIVRSGVVFGKGENGNFTKLHNALKKNLFVYVGRKDTIKGSIYVKDVVNFINFILTDTNERIIYNFVFPGPDTIEEICMTMCSVMGWKRFIPIIPFRVLLLLSFIFEFLNQIGIKNPIHHRRIEKLYYSTHLSSDAALDSGFQFSFTLKSALEDWKKECDGKGLF